MTSIARNLTVSCLAAAVLCLAPAAAADTLTSTAADGYGRLVFALTPDDKMTVQTSGAILTITFDRKVAITPATIMEALPAYFAGGRVDPDGKTFRFALNQPVRVHTSTSGSKFAVDLAPQSYAGTPPDLPPPPAPPPKSVDLAKLETLKVRSGSYHNFTRLVFDWPRPVPYTVFPGAGKLTVRFEALAKPDLSPLTDHAPPWVKAASWRIENRGTVVELATDAASGFHDFRDGTHVVIDVLAPKTDADAYNPPGGGKAQVTTLSPAKPTKNEVSAQAQAILAAASKLNGSEPQATAPPAQLVPPKPQSPAAALAPQSVAPVPASSPADASAAAQGATPVDAQTAQSTLTRDGAVLTFPGAGRRSSAVFIRGLTAWIILQGAMPLDANKLKSELGTFPDGVDAISGDGMTELRLTLKQPEQIAAIAEGSMLKVVIAPQVNTNAVDIGFARSQSDPAHSSISTLLPGATATMQLVDPVAGDEMIVVAGAPGRNIATDRNYAEFSALRTASGIVLLPYVDDLKVTVATPRVTIARPGGLSLTQSTMPGSSEAVAHAGNSPCFLDLAKWKAESGGTFLATERRLRAAIARLQVKDANRARLRLAEFYLANGFDAEALGIIGVMQASDPALQSDMQLQTMRAAADLSMGRTIEARNAIAAAEFDSDRHAALWRGLIEAAQESWDTARTDLERALPVLDAYQPDMQARARLALAEAALGLGRLEIADAQLARLPAMLEGNLQLAAELDRARLYAAENRRSEADRLFAEVETGGDERLACEAIYHRVVAAEGAGKMKPQLAINALERLRYRWRGDLLELKTLRKLAAIYFAGNRWREGLTTLRIAAENFPNDDLSGQAQDDMRSAFVDLFLKGKGDSMPPVQALALFYDFIDLTPIGPDGDEMIRHMADRLVAVDLLGPAADLLNYQITKRLDGVARAQVATRLAMVQLMDHKPEAALETLQSTQISTLPDDVAHQRLLLQARALADEKQYEAALDLISVDQAADTAKLRADIYWRNGNWPLAGQKAEDALGTCWSDASPLTDDERQEVMRAAVAYSLANDETSLERLRTHFQGKMQSSPDASAFAVVTQRIDMHGLAFRDAAAKVASIDMLQSFMKDLQKLRTE